MKIALTLNNQKYYIYVDSKQFTAGKVITNQKEGGDNFGKEQERDLGYYTTLKACGRSIIKDAMASSDETLGFSEFINRYEKLKEEVESYFDLM